MVNILTKTHIIFIPNSTVPIELVLKSKLVLCNKYSMLPVYISISNGATKLMFNFVGSGVESLLRLDPLFSLNHLLFLKKLCIRCLLTSNEEENSNHEE